MAGSVLHSIIAEAAAEFLPAPVADACRRHAVECRAGSLWPDTLGVAFLPERLGRFIGADGSVDARLVRDVLAGNDAPPGIIEELDARGLLGRIEWVAGHGLASPDLYAREMRLALGAGAGQTVAFMAGFLTHIAEYAAHFKAQEAMLTVFRPELRSPLPVHKGQPFFDLAAAGAGPEGGAAALVALAREAMPGDRDAGAAACQRRLVAEGVGSLFERGLRLQRAIATCRAPGELRGLAGEFRSLAARGLARVFEYCSAVCSEALLPGGRGGAGEAARGEVLLLVRGDLWLRHPLGPPLEATSPGVARLRLAAALERLGLDYELASGDEPLDFGRWPVVVSLEGWSFDAARDEAVYDSLRRAAGGGTRVVVVGEPHPSRTATAVWRDLAACHGVWRCAEVDGMVRCLDDALGPGRIDPGAARPPQSVLDAADEIASSPPTNRARMADPGFLGAAFGAGEGRPS